MADEEPRVGNKDVVISLLRSVEPEELGRVTSLLRDMDIPYSIAVDATPWRRSTP